MSGLDIRADTKRPVTLKAGGEFDVYTRRLLTQAWCLKCSITWSGRKAGIEARRHTRETGHSTARFSGELDSICLRGRSPLGGDDE